MSLAQWARLLAWLRRRWVLLAGAITVIAFLLWSAHGAVEAGHARRRAAAEAAAQRARIEELGNTVVASQVEIEQSLAILQAATSKEAQDRAAATLAQAIAELRKSINCVGFYTMDKRPPACADTDDRMDRLNAGEDPFAVPTPTPGGGSP